MQIYDFNLGYTHVAIEIIRLDYLAQLLSITLSLLILLGQIKNQVLTICPGTCTMAFEASASLFQMKSYASALKSIFLKDGDKDIAKNN